MNKQTNMKNAVQKAFQWISGLFKDEKGIPSSKRFVGIMCSIALCVTMYHNSFSTVDVAPAQYLVDAVALLAFGTLGLASVDKIFGKKGKDTTEDNTEA